MKTKDWFWAIVEAGIWYVFICYLLYAIKNPVNLWQSTLILLVLGYFGTIACPWLHNTDAWKRLWGEQR